MFPQLLSLLTTFPGNLLVHLVLAVMIAAALKLSSQYQKINPGPAGKNIYRALVVLVTARLGIFIIGTIAQTVMINPSLVLAPLDRLVTTISLAWAAWAWIQHGTHKTLDAALTGVQVVAAVLFLAAIPGWLGAASLVAFSETWYRLYWELLSLLIVLVGSILLLRQHLPGWRSGLTFLILHFAGPMADLFLVHTPTNFSAPLILAQLAAYPFLLNLPRSPISIKPQVVPSHPITRERRRYATDRKTFQAALQLAVETRPNQVWKTITRFAGHMMVSDLVFLASAPDATGEIHIEGGYDLIQEEYWPGATIKAAGIPDLARALGEGHALRIIQGDTLFPDLAALARALAINETGNLMLVPLVHEINGPLGGLLFLSSYSRRIWSQADEEYLLSGTSQLVQVLCRASNSTRSPRGGVAEKSTQPLDHGLISDIISADERPAVPASPGGNMAARPHSAPPEPDPIAARHQIEDLEEALFYARQRLERLEGRHQPARGDPSHHLGPLLEGALLQAASLSDDRHVTMRLDIPDTLPPLQADPATMKEVLVIALQKALLESAASGTIVLKAQAGASQAGKSHVHLKVISTGSPAASGSIKSPQAGTAANASNQDLLLRARSLLETQAGKIWVDPPTGGAIVTNLVVPAVPDPGKTASQS